MALVCRSVAPFYIDQMNWMNIHNGCDDSTIIHCPGIHYYSQLGSDNVAKAVVFSVVSVCGCGCLSVN